MLKFPMLIVALSFPSYACRFVAAAETSNINEVILGVFFLLMSVVLGLCLKHITNKDLHTTAEAIEDMQPNVTDLVTEKSCAARVETIQSVVKGVKSELKADIAGIRAEINLIVSKQTETCDLLKEVIRKLK